MIDADGAQAGRVACWGANTSGELGRNTSPRLDEPTITESTRTFETLVTGSARYCGITRDGATYCCGRGTSGELGQGTANSIPPVQLPD